MPARSRNSVSFSVTDCGRRVRADAIHRTYRTSAHTPQPSTRAAGSQRKPASVATKASMKLHAERINELIRRMSEALTRMEDEG